MNVQELKKTANQVRKNIITEVFYAKAGHPGGSLSAAEIYTYLYMVEMNIDPANPSDPDRDRFVLSKGHTCPGLYGVMAERGFFDREECKTFRHLGARLQGHPSMRLLPGIDMSTGSLGQGISCAVGMALAAKLMGKDYRTYTRLGDGELEEGQVWEASMFAGAKKLDNLCVIVDNNNLQIDGTIEEVNSPYPIDKKFEARSLKLSISMSLMSRTGTILTSWQLRSQRRRRPRECPPLSSARPSRARAYPSWRTPSTGTERLRMRSSTRLLWQTWKGSVRRYE